MSLSELKGHNVDAKIWAPLEQVEPECLNQIRNITKLPWIYKHVAVMADCHAGIGCVVGSVIATKDSVSPSFVGVDIGCGMGAVATNLTSKDLPENLKNLRERIEKLIPVGFNEHRNNLPMVKRSQLFADFRNLHKGVQNCLDKAKSQIGTLGGGNHFIELCLDSKDRVWLTLHSGSRYLGNRIAQIHMNIAAKLEHNKSFDKELAAFLNGTPEMDQYRHDLYFAQEYAFLNRRAMLELFMKAVSEVCPKVKFEDPILCHHNYVAEEMHFGEKVFVTRKGAINASKDIYGLIPGSMGTSSFIVRGLGNPESFESASHGAGRKMSRRRAKATFTIEDVKKQTEGVECRKDSGIIDELPSAYKDINQVMENQKDLVEVVETLKQILCVKG